MEINTKFWNGELLLDTESADYCEKNEDGTLNQDKPTPWREWTRLVQWAYYEDGIRLEEGVIDLHPDVTSHTDAASFERLKELVHGCALCVIQQAKYDIPRLQKLGIHVMRYRDTLILSQMLHVGKGFRHSLNDILQRENGFDPYANIGRDRIVAESHQHVFTFGDKGNPLPTKGIDKAPLSAEEARKIWVQMELSKTKHNLQSSDWSLINLSEEQKDYAEMDVSDHYYRAWRKLEAQVETMGMSKIVDVEHQFLLAVMDMERNGIKTHLDKWADYIRKAESELAVIEQRIKDVVDPLTQAIYPEKFMITLKRKKPLEGKPERRRKDGSLIRAEIPAQLVGDLAAKQPTPELFPMMAPTQDLLDQQHDDYRVGSVAWAELGLTTSERNMDEHTWNISSATQMRSLVNDVLGISYHNPDGTINKAQMGFAEDDVEELLGECQRQLDESSGAHSLIVFQLKKMMEDYQSAQTLRTILRTFGWSYMAKADKCGYIRTSFQTTATKTGRMSSSDPNIQNITRELQALIFCCEEWEAMVSVDYSNMEGRTLFYVTKQEDIYNALTDGMDLHSLSASFMLGKPYDDLTERLPGETKDTIKKQFKAVRQDAKAVTFAPMFGCGIKRIMALLKCDFNTSKGFLARYWTTYHITKKNLDRQFDSAVNNGYITDLAFGRKRFFKMKDEDRLDIANGMERKDVLGKWKTEAYNYAAQSGGATCLKVALIHLRNWIQRHPETGTILRIVIHDSIKVTCKPEYAVFVGNEIKRIMENAAEFVLGGARVPADVEVYFDHTAPVEFNLQLAA